MEQQFVEGIFVHSAMQFKAKKTSFSDFFAQSILLISKFPKNVLLRFFRFSRYLNSTPVKDQKISDGGGEFKVNRTVVQKNIFFGFLCVVYPAFL